ncbi:hypothetical protein ACA910_008591 [Epithemia clementina (nom. ined.)]
MDEARDEVYCHLTARRSVATAALRLGLERMSEEALDALAGVLLSYLDRLGQTLAMGVEASGRSSAHCNILDCLRAVEQCTVPAVQRVHMDALLHDNDVNSSNNPAAIVTNNGNNNNNGSDGNTLDSRIGGSGSAFRMDPTEIMSWKGLAAFCFGPDWAKPIVSSDETTTTNGATMVENGNNGAAAAMAAASREQNLGGGKVGPTGDGGGPDPMMMAMSNMMSGQGWHAPFPDEIPAFPVTWQNQTANPAHPSLIRTAESLHIHETFPPPQKQEQQASLDAEEVDSAQNIPDKFFQRWGETGYIASTFTKQPNSTTGGGTKRKREDESSQQQENNKQESETKNSGDGAAPAVKKAKGDDSGKAATTHEDQDEEEEEEEEDERHPIFIPRHFPPFPRPTDLVGPMVADDDDEEAGGGIMPTTEQPKEGGEDDAAKKQSLSVASYGGTTSEILDDTEYEPTLKVRSALVRMGRPWGAIGDMDDTTTTATDDFSISAKKFHVPPGSSSTASAAGANDPAAQQQTPQLKAQIVPLGRASGSRVSRILEGSMDS